MTNTKMPQGLELLGAVNKEQSEILTPAALEFLLELHREFNPRRQELLRLRKLRQEEIDRGEMPHFCSETKTVRDSAWQVDAVPADLQNRRVEITGPVD